MQILVINPTLQTTLFGIIFILAVVISIKKSGGSFFSTSKTLELKGFAILAIIFSHIGYFLSKDSAFLYPFSVAAGVGVDLFLFLSGFGLTISSLKSPLSIWGFYKKRLKKLFIPMWMVLLIFITLDFIILQRIYSTTIITESFLGFFPTADLFKNLDSPLWYFSLILFFYLIFPIFFWKKFQYLCPLIIFGLCYFVLQYQLPFIKNTGVQDLYKVHYASFPLGVLFGILVTDKNFANIRSLLQRLSTNLYIKYLMILIFLLIFSYTAINSGVGKSANLAQAISILTMFSVVFVFILKDWGVKIFSLFGFYSYEIYLIHWPILSRYDLLYKYLPPFLATILYLGFFLLLGYLLNKVTKIILK